MEAAVRPERLLKDLRNLWVDLGKHEPAGVLRACAMTLIVVVEEERDAQAIGETIAALDARASRAARSCCAFAPARSRACRLACSRNAGCPSEADSRSAASRWRSSAVSPASRM